MLEAIKEASKFLVVPTAVLYLLGFLCVTGFYGQFGIVTFEVVNARFLIAGMYVAVALGFASFGAWQLCQEFVAAVLTDKLGRIRVRLWLYGAFVFYPWFFGYLLSLLLSISRRGESGSRLQLKLTPLLGSFDFIGQQLERLFGSPNDLTWIVFYSANLAAWILIAWLILEATRALGGLLGFRVPKSWVRSKPPAQVPVAAKSAAPVVQTRENRYVRAVDILAVSVLGILLVYSTSKVYADIFDLQAVGRPLTLDSGLIFAWLYYATILMFIFVAPFVRPNPIGANELVKEFLTFDRFTDVMLYVLVPLLALVFFFGATIFPRIPFSLGGAEPREVHVVTATGEWEPSKKVYLLGESSEFLFVVTTDGQEARSYELNKQEILEVRTRTAPVHMANWFNYAF